jgi:hypothetical protein
MIMHARKVLVPILVNVKFSWHAYLDCFFMNLLYIALQWLQIVISLFFKFLFGLCSSEILLLLRVLICVKDMCIWIYLVSCWGSNLIHHILSIKCSMVWEWHCCCSHMFQFILFSTKCSMIWKCICSCSLMFQFILFSL